MAKREVPAISRLCTIEEGRTYLNNNYEQGVSCPCCDGYVKEYRRSLYYKMALPLIRLYRQTNQDPRQPVHVSLFNPSSGGGDFAKVAYWELAYEQPKLDNRDKKTSGMWFITQRGIDFVANRLTVQKYAHIVMGKVLKFSGPNFTIVEALGKRFSYSELMGG